MKKAFITGVTGRDRVSLSSLLLRKVANVHGVDLRVAAVALFCLTALIRSPQALAQDQGPAPQKVQLAPSAVDPVVLDRLLNIGPQEHVIRPDDTLAVTAYGVKDFNFRERVSSTGLISLPLIGQIPVVGLSPHAAAALIAQELTSQGMVLNPQVDVTFVSEPSSVVTVTGEVNKAGAFPAVGTLTLGSVLGLAGGLRDTASPVVTLLRPGTPGPIAIPVAVGSGFTQYTNIPLLAGDHVIVSRVGQFYVVGAVAKQGPVPLKNSTPTTLLEAISLAGGAGFQADLEDSAIVRNAPGGPLVIPVDLRKLPRQAQENVTLQPDDVVFIPTSSMRAAIKAGGTGIVIALSNFGSYFRN